MPIVNLFIAFNLLRIAQYYYWIYLTFSHIQEEQKDNQIKPYRFKMNRLPQRANYVSYVILIFIILIVLVFGYTMIVRVQLNLRQIRVISIGLFGYLGYLITSPLTILGYLIFMYIEVRAVRKCAMIFDEVHLQVSDEDNGEKTM